MDNVAILILAGIFIIISVGATVAIFLVYVNKIRQGYEQRLLRAEESLKTALKTSTSTQRSVIKGQIAEQMFPILQQELYGYELSDMQFIGKLFDYLVTVGYTESKDNGGQIEKVVFLDIKTGDAQLSRHQKQMKRAIDSKQVEWKTVVVSNTGELSER